MVGCGRGISAVRARVRAYRSTGARGAPQVGPWSKVSQAMRLRPFVDEEKVEIAEIPGSWAAVDVVGVEDLDERKVGPEELQPFLASLTHPHAHSHTLTPPLTPGPPTDYAPRRRGRSARGPRRRAAARPTAALTPSPTLLAPVAGRSRGASAAQAGAACGDAQAPHGPQAAVSIPRPSLDSIATLAFCFCAPHLIPHCPPQVVKLAFRYYALAGVQNPTDNADTIAMVQFSNFCGACDLFEEEDGPNTDRRDRLSRSPAPLPPAATHA